MSSVPISLTAMPNGLTSKSWSRFRNLANHAKYNSGYTMLFVTPTPLHSSSILRPKSFKHNETWCLSFLIRTWHVDQCVCVCDGVRGDGQSRVGRVGRVGVSVGFLVGVRLALCLYASLASLVMYSSRLRNGCVKRARRSVIQTISSWTAKNLSNVRCAVRPESKRRRTRSLRSHQLKIGPTALFKAC